MVTRPFESVLVDNEMISIFSSENFFEISVRSPDLFSAYTTISTIYLLPGDVA